MVKAHAVQQAGKVLRAFYADHKDAGILAIYLWGSILTEDFDEKKSDIDSIALVGKDLSLREEKKAIKALSRVLPGLSIRFLYVSELMGGNIKGNLARHIHPRMLALDFPNWKWIAGTKYPVDSFERFAATPREAVGLTIQQMYRKNIPEVRREKDKEKYFVKAMARLCYYLEQEGVKSRPFSYSSISRTGVPDRKSIVRAIISMRRGNYDVELFRKNRDLFLDFLETCKRTYDL